MGSWSAAEACYRGRARSRRGVSPLPCAQLLFEWGVHAMRQGQLDQAESRFAALHLILPAHVPGRGHRAEVALERGQLDRALALITPLLEISDDPEYRATYAQILVARGEHQAAAREAERAADGLRAAARAAARSIRGPRSGILHGHRRPPAACGRTRGMANWKLRDTPRARSLLFRAQRNAVEPSELANSTTRRIA